MPCACHMLDPKCRATVLIPMRSAAQSRLPEKNRSAEVPRVAGGARHWRSGPAHSGSEEEGEV